MIVTYFQNVWDNEKCFYFVLIKTDKERWHVRELYIQVIKRVSLHILPYRWILPLFRFVRKFGGAVVNASVNEGYKP